MGHGRFRAGTGVHEEVRIGERAERAHPPNNAEGGRQRDVPHGNVNGVSATRTGHRVFTGPDESSAEQLRSVLGITQVNFVRGQHTLAIVDTPLSGLAMMSGMDMSHDKDMKMSADKGKMAGAEKPGTNEVFIDNFSFSPASITVPVGTKITWTNKDDVPHNVVSTAKAFASPVLDTDEKFSFTFDKAGTFDYYCSIHPRMTAKVIVQGK